MKTSRPRRAESQIERYLKKGKKAKPAPQRPIPESEIPGVYIKDSRDMTELPKESVHLVVSSPPYFVGMEYEKGMTFNEHLDMIGDVMKECSRVLVKGGVIALNVGDIPNFKGPKGNNDFRQVQTDGAQIPVVSYESMEVIPERCDHLAEKRCMDEELYRKLPTGHVFIPLTG